MLHYHCKAVVNILFDRIKSFLDYREQPSWYICDDDVLMLLLGKRCVNDLVGDIESMITVAMKTVSIRSLKTMSQRIV